MNPPFTIDAFLRVFADYNAAIWPFQIVAYGLGLVVIAPLFIAQQGSVRLALAALAILWAVTGIGYHLTFFVQINPIAPVFAAFFVLQAIFFLASAIRPANLHLHLAPDFRTVAGLATIIYAVAIYPVLGIWAGHGLLAGPMFGVAPCPTTIFSIGMLLLTRGVWVIWLSVIPFMWSLIGLAAAIQLGMPEDLAMPIAGALLAGTLLLQTHASRRNDRSMVTP